MNFRQEDRCPYKSQNIHLSKGSLELKISIPTGAVLELKTIHSFKAHMDISPNPHLVSLGLMNDVARTLASLPSQTSIFQSFALSPVFLLIFFPTKHNANFDLSTPATFWARETQRGRFREGKIRYIYSSLSKRWLWGAWSLRSVKSSARLLNLLFYAICTFFFFLRYTCFLNDKVYFL